MFVRFVIVVVVLLGSSLQARGESLHCWSFEHPGQTRYVPEGQQCPSGWRIDRSTKEQFDAHQAFEARTRAEAERSRDLVVDQYQPEPLDQYLDRTGSKVVRHDVPPMGWGDYFGAAVDRTNASLLGAGEALGLPVGGNDRRYLEQRGLVIAARAREDLDIASKFGDARGFGGVARWAGGLAVESTPFLGSIFILAIAVNPSRRWLLSFLKRSRTAKKMNQASVSPVKGGVGGWLLTLCILMMYVWPITGTLMTFGSLASLERQIGGVPGFAVYKSSMWVVQLATVGLTFWTGWQLKNKLVPQTVAFAKKMIWLMFGGVAVLVGVVIPTISFGFNADIVASGIFSIFSSTLIAAGLVLYLNKSKPRIRDPIVKNPTLLI